MALGSNVSGNINLVINAHANTVQAEKRLKAMGRATTSIQAQVEAINRKVSTTGINDKRAFADAQHSAQRLRNDYRQVAEASGQYLTVQKTITSETTNFNKALSRSKIGWKDVRGQMGMVREAMREQMALNKMIVTQYSKDATGKISADIFVPPASSIKLTQNLRTQLGYYNKVLHSVSEQTVNWGKNTQWAGRQLTVGFSVPLSIAAGMLSKFAIEADRGLTRIAKVYGDTEAAFQVSNESIRNMAQETAMYIADQYGLAATETRNVMAELAATGLGGSELQGMTVQVQRASLLGEMSSEDSLKLLRVMKEVYGFSAAEMEKQVNYFNAIENATALTMQDITEGLPRISGIMQATGVSIQEQTELLVAFKSAGIDVAEGANALKSINFKAVAASPTAAKNFFRITGVEMESLIEKTDGEFLPMMKEIANVMDGLESREQVELVARIFGIHQGSRAITLLRQLADGSEGMLRATEIGLQDAETHAKSAAEEIRTIQESLAVRYDRLVQTIRATMEELGLPVLDMLITVGEGLVKALEWINNLPDAAKHIGAWVGLGLALTGPLVMVTGLFANLIGIVGRLGSTIIGLAAPFKVLEPSAKAAELLQQKFGTTAARTESHVKSLATGIDGLTKVMERMARTAEIAQQRLEGIQISAAGLNDPKLWKLDAMDQNLAGVTNPYANLTTPLRKGEYGPSQTPVNTANKPISARWTPYGTDWRQKRGEFIAANEQKKYGEINLPASYAKATNKAQEFEFAARAGTKSVEETNRAVLRMSSGIAAASGAAMGLGMIFENQWLTNLSMGAMILSSMTPLINSSISMVSKLNNNMINSTSVFTSQVGQKFAAMATGVAGFFKSTFKVLAGPVGLALAGAVAVGIAAWKRYDKKIEETRKMHETLGESAKDALGDIYNFTPTTPLERISSGDHVMAENTLGAQEQRIKLMQEEQKDYYDALILKSEKIRENFSYLPQEQAKARQQQEILNEAMRQGALVLQQSGDPEKAKMAAWDIYNAMSEEWVSFRDFKVKVSLDGQSVDDLLDDLTGYIEGALVNNSIFDEMQLDLKAKSFGGFTLRKDDREKYMQDIQQMLNMIGEMEPEQGMSAYKRFMGEEMDDIAALYQEALELKVIDESMTGEKFVRQWRQISRDAREAGGELWNSQTEKELGKTFEIMSMMRDISPRLIDDVFKWGDSWARAYAGLNMDIELFINHKKEEILLTRLAEAEARKDQDAIRSITGELQGMRAMAGISMEKVKTGLSAIDEVTNKFGAAFRGERVSEGLEDVGDSAEDALEEVEELDEGLSKIENRRVTAHRTSMEWAQQQLVEPYRKELENMHNAQLAYQDGLAEDAIESIENEFDGHEKVMEAEHKAREKALEATHKNQDKALDAEKKRADKALRKAQEAEKKALDARGKAMKEAQKAENEALKDRFELLGEELEKRQEARQEAIEKSYDTQIEKIRKQIEEEERLEAKRQEMYERERERLQRMAGLFDSNVSLNMAVNSGDLDEAARIANDINTRQSEWAMQDLSAISGDASESRRDQMEKKIDSLEERKEAELERIKEVEEAEKEALEAREEREQAALDAKYERIEAEIEAEKEKLAELHELQREALSEDFALRSEKLAERQAKEKEVLDAETEAEKTELAERRQNRIDSQTLTNQNNRAALEERLADEKASFDMQAEHFENMIATNEDDFVDGHEDMQKYFREVHGIQIKDDDAVNLSEIWKQRNRIFENKMKELANDDMWELNAERIAKAIMNGIIGESLTTDQIRDFIVNGELPKNLQSKQGVNDVNRMGAVPRHSGGIIGNPADDSWTGPGFYSKSQEVPLVGLKGEGVLNLNAMRQPGVPELMYALNSGKKINETIRSRPSNMRQKGDGPGITGGVFGGLTAIARRIAQMATISGAEHGYGKLLQRVGISSTDIAYDGSHGVMSTEQLKNAGYIISTGRRLGASERDIMTALMTAMQESSLINVNYGDDIHGVRNPDGTLTSSLGLFQQQKWWGSVEDRMNPSKSAELFYRALFGIENRNSMPLWAAAQAVQRSAFPRAYARWEGLAAALLGGAKGGMTVAEAADVEPGMTWPSIWNLVKAIAPEASMTSNYREGARTRGYGNLSYHGKGQAIDIISPDMMATYNKLRDVLPWNEAIYTPAGSKQVRNGRYYRELNPITMMDHMDHIHLAYDGMVANFKPIVTDSNKTLQERADELRKAIAEIRDSGVGFNAGGLVPGYGNGDSVNARLTPGEFVMSKRATMGNVDLFKAFNNGTIDLSQTARRMAGNVDNGGGTRYDINIEFSGPVNSEIDFEKVVSRTIRGAERKKNHSRRIG